MNTMLVLADAWECVGFSVVAIIVAIVAIVGFNLNVRDEKNRLNRELEAKSLTCQKCDGLARPIYGSGNRYRCPKCGNQFAGADHNLFSKSATAAEEFQKQWSAEAPRQATTPPPAPPARVCPRCKNRNLQEDAAFCNRCGQKLSLPS